MQLLRRLMVTLLLGFLGQLCEGNVYPYRWVYVGRSLRRDSHVEEIESIVKTASEHGLNGMVLARGLDASDLQSPHYFARLEKVKEISKKHNVEIIPTVFSVGYGTAVLGHDRNLAAGIPVRDALFVVEDGKANLVPDPPVEIVNGGFEEYEGTRLKGYRFHDRLGHVSFVDKEVFKNGKASLRFEGFERHEHGYARVMQEVKVHPYRCYRLSCWVKTEGLEPQGSLRMVILGSDGRKLAPWDPGVPSTADWRNMIMGFHSIHYDRVRVYVGVLGGKSGKVWIDDLGIEEIGLLNVLRRPGTPVTVRGEETGRLHEEGTDFAPIKDPTLNFRFDHDPCPIEILPGSGINEGDRLRVSCYQGTAMRAGQIGLCMSEPKLYEVWKEQAKLIHKYLAPTKYFLKMDEIRAGGACEACKRRKMTMAQILGDCITKQVQIIRELNPKAEVFIWSDMLDPNHNAHGNYYLVDGDFTGSWKYVPEDLVIVCWSYKRRRESLKFFSSLGFRTLAGAYYDGDTLDNPRGWLEVLDHTSKACGIMYTTWRNKYELLAPFGDLVTGEAN